MSFVFSRRCSYRVSVNAMQIEYPEAWAAAAGSSAERFEGEARMALAMNLFEMGRLSSGQAAQLAGVSRVFFLLSCPPWNVRTVAWRSPAKTRQQGRSDHLSVHSGAKREYERRHRPIWPELEQVLLAHGVRTYSIFLYAETRQLFAYVEFESHRADGGLPALVGSHARVNAFPS